MFFSTSMAAKDVLLGDYKIINFLCRCVLQFANVVPDVKWLNAVVICILFAR